jgi:hypothetical protein
MHLHFATALPIDDLRLCEYEVQKMFSDEDANPGDIILQRWLRDFLPQRDVCGKFILPR